MAALDKAKILARLKAKTVYQGQCWIYRDNGEPGIYKQLGINGHHYRINRLSLFIFKNLDLVNGDIQANHIRECSNKDCWNPEHLYIGTQKDNVADILALGHHKEQKKICCSTCGSAYSVSPKTGDRYCQVCKNRRRDIWRKKNKHTI